MPAAIEQKDIPTMYATESQYALGRYGNWMRRLATLHATHLLWVKGYYTKLINEPI